MPDIQEDNIKISYEYFMVSNPNKAILIQDMNRTKFCAFCSSDLDIEEGVTIYDKNWYHDGCWNSFETQSGVVKHD
jgi:hypothetical protein